MVNVLSLFYETKLGYFIIISFIIRLDHNSFSTFFDTCVDLLSHSRNILVAREMVIKILTHVSNVSTRCPFFAKRKGFRAVVIRNNLLLWRVWHILYFKWCKNDNFLILTNLDSLLDAEGKCKTNTHTPSPHIWDTLKRIKLCGV